MPPCCGPGTVPSRGPRPGGCRAAALSDDHGRAAEEQRVTEARRRAAVERTCCYETATAAVVVDGSDRVMPVRLVLPEEGVRWGGVQPAPADLAQL
ncbi:hypothetical protein VR45_09775 [Streptomyces sp. NRRL S-495]|nr:hypothetical protein VR45_09775 [Streptomyces sp. NRRL S-495]